MKKYLKERNGKIIVAFYTKRRERKSVNEAILEIQQDGALNPSNLSFDYIRRHIIFDKESVQ